MKKIIKSFLRNRGIYIRKSNFIKNELINNKIIFIHVPKVAGNGLLKSLGFTYTTHVRLYMYELEDKEKFNDYFKIGFVRNPWDRLASAFFYLKHGGDNNNYDLGMKDKLNRFDTFENFVLELDSNEKFRNEILNEIHFSSQYSWLMNLSGEIDMDCIGRFESLEDGFLILKEKLHKEDAQLKKHNVSNHKPYWTYYNEETVEIVRKIYSKDIMTFNYDFPYEKIESKG